MLSNDLQWLSRILYPNGRAYSMPVPQFTPDEYTTEDGSEVYTTEDGLESYTAEGALVTGGYLWRLHRALNKSFERLWADAKSISYSMLPDNPFFTMDDAVAWYRRLGLYNSGSVSLTDMKAAIRQKLSFPVTPLNAQHYTYIEAQLQAAGFDVYVYENRFYVSSTWVTETPSEILGTDEGNAYLNEFSLGDTDLNHEWDFDNVTLIANYLEESKDAHFAIAPNYRSTFFVASATIDTFASAPLARKQEFRQLLMKLKQQTAIGFLFINYT